MLTSKFAIAPISAITVGPPTPNVTWNNPENPDVTVAGTWQFPVTVTFSAPTASARQGSVRSSP